MVGGDAVVQMMKNLTNAFANNDNYVLNVASESVGGSGVVHDQVLARLESDYWTG
jgi:hypothetical protein